MTASSALAGRPVQLTLELTGRACRRLPASGRAARRSFWNAVDVVDVGGPTLRACGAVVRACIDLEECHADAWVGHHDLVLGAGGTSGCTPQQPTRHDALVSAAHALMRHCRAIVRRAECHRRSDVRAAKEVIRWLEYLDLL